MIALRQSRASVGRLIFVASLLSTSFSLAQDQAAEPAAAAAGNAAAADPALAAAIEAGHTEYLKNCRTCHGSKGTAGVPLAGNEKVSAGPDYLIWAIITGPGYMPDFGTALSDQQIAAIATYIGNSWGNANGLVAPEDVAAVR
jgi:mono/diheme cytochrome c family protein